MNTDYAELDVAWAAGFFDGEGSISIRKTYSKLKSQGTTRQTYGLYLRVAQVDRSPLDKFTLIFGTGSVNKVRRDDPNRPMYHDWCAAGESAARILARMLPYLTVKRERALLGLEFQQITGRNRIGRGALTDGELDLRRQYWAKMRFLNLRQVPRAAAETERARQRTSEAVACDSPSRSDDKAAEHDRNDRALHSIDE